MGNKKILFGKTKKPKMMLNEKEKQIVQGLAEGKPQKQVASDVGLTESGLEWYLKKMFNRYNVANSVELVAYCIGKEWVTVEKHSDRDAA